jgi:hypothetical protein
MEYQVNKPLLKLGGLVLSLLSIGFSTWAGYLVVQGLEAEKWPEVDAKIVALKHYYHNRGYLPALIVEYKSDQKDHHATILLSHFVRSYSNVSVTLAKYKVGTPLRIKVNPTDFSECFYGTKIYWDAAFIVALAIICLGLVMVFILLFRLPRVEEIKSL